MMKELIIKVDNHHIHLGPKMTVPIGQTNIPIDHCSFRSHYDIYWKVNLLDYNSDTKCLKIKVIDYSVKDTINYESQNITTEVDRIAFEKFDWPKFELHLSSYQKSSLLVVLDNHDADKFFREKTRRKIEEFDVDYFKKMVDVNLPQGQDNLVALNPAPKGPIVFAHSVEFAVYFTEARFRMGYVTFNKHIRKINKAVSFKIQNDHILAEFDSIKSWFAKKLKTKKFDVIATILLTDGEVTDTSANSPQIAMIGPDLVDSIKYQRTIALTKSPGLNETDKSLFTADEIFGEMESDDPAGNVFKQSEQDILSLLLDNYETRNKRHLQYLSGSKQSEKSKLRFTLHPHFGFLFFIEGEESNHFVWELLNSHATYIWSIEKSKEDIELQYRRIEQTINTIRNIGRDQYKRAYRQKHHDSDLVFSSIEHDSITSNFVDGFVKWKHKLNERLI